MLDCPYMTYRCPFKVCDYGMCSHFSNLCLIFFFFWKRVGYMLFNVKTELMTHWPHHHKCLTSQKYCQSRETGRTTQRGQEVSPSGFQLQRGLPALSLALPCFCVGPQIAPFFHQSPSLRKGNCARHFKCQRETTLPSSADPFPDPQLQVPVPHPQLILPAWHPVSPKTSGVNSLWKSMPILSLAHFNLFFLRIDFILSKFRVWISLPYSIPSAM